MTGHDFHLALQVARHDEGDCALCGTRVPVGGLDDEDRCTWCRSQ